MIAALLTHPAVLRGASWLADDTGNNSGGENKKSGPIGVVVIIVLCVACYFLFKSLSKHLKRVREEFPGSSAAPPSASPSPSSPANRVVTPSADGVPDADPDQERAGGKT